MDVHLPGSGAVRAAVPADRATDLDSVMDPEGTPFTNADPRAAHQMEITTGLVARTQPGWGILVRGLANWGHQRDHQVLDGFMETDWYRSFLPVIIRATTPGAEVRFFRQLPMAQLVVLPMVAPGQAVQINTTMVASVGVLEGAGAVLAGGVAAAPSVPAAYLLVGVLVLAMSLPALRSASTGGVPQPV